MESMTYSQVYEQVGNEYRINSYRFIEADFSEKFNFILTGGGTLLASMPSIMGASKNLSSAYIPYSEEHSSKIIGDCKSVSIEAIERYLDYMENQNPDQNNVACSAALTTNRYRKGENKAVIGISWANGTREVAVIELFKHTAEQYFDMDGLSLKYWRQIEESITANYILRMIFKELTEENFGVAEFHTYERI